MQYLIQVTIYTGIMLTVYLLLLKDKPLHQLSRTYLLANTMIPLVLPLVTLPEILQSKMPTVSIMPVQLGEINISANSTGQPGLFSLLVYTYAGIVMLLIAIQLINLYRINYIARKADRTYTDEYTLLRHTGYGPGSWGRYIFLPNSESNKDIIAHEAAHIQLKHTYDLFLLNVVQALCWPNVFLVLLKRELVLVHEFQADARVDTDKEQYAHLLVSSLFSPCTLPMTHSFIVHPIKRRIMMLYKKTNRSSIVRKSLLVAGITGLLASCIISLQSCERTTPDKPKSGALIQESEPGKPAVYTYVKQMPEFKGNLAEYLGKNIKYPEEAKTQKIEGRVVVRFTIDERGKIIDPIVKKSPNQLLSNEAIRVISTMPDWTPGEQDGEKVKVSYTLPIAFKLQADNPAKK